jgi:hypothetical protein
MRKYADIDREDDGSHHVKALPIMAAHTNGHEGIEQQGHRPHDPRPKVALVAMRPNR